MTTIFFANTPQQIDRFLAAHKPRSLRFIPLGYTRAFPEVRRCWARYGVDAVTVQGQEYIQDFERLFADYLGGVNIRYADFLWWALDLSNKNPITTRLFYSVYYSLLIKEVVAKDQPECVCAFGQEGEVADVVRRHFQACSDIRVLISPGRADIWETVKAIIPIAPFFKCFWAAAGRVLSRFFLPPCTEGRQPLTIVLSLLYGPCFKGGKFQDVYFGDFIPFLKTRRIPFINLMEVCAPYARMMKEIRKMAGDLPIYPREYFLKPKYIFRSLGIALKKYFKREQLSGLPAFQGLDISSLLNDYIRKEYISTRFVSNLLRFYSVISLTEDYPLARFYYPFENRSFEKMAVLALRQQSPATKITGYQHASCSRRHLNFMLAEGEAEITPLPDRIITMGEVTREFLAGPGRFPPNILEPGCALRQKPYRGAIKAKKASVKNILVTLATDIEEYVKTLFFLDAAFRDTHDYTIWIRPHPVFSLDEALAITGPLSMSFHKADRESLQDSFEWADVILYVHSITSCEALMRGIPVIRIKVDNPVNPDPLLGFSDFKWEAGDGRQLFAALQEIDGMTEARYRELQERGRDYALRYIRPSTPECLERFLQ